MKTCLFPLGCYFAGNKLECVTNPIYTTTCVGDGGRKIIERPILFGWSPMEWRSIVCIHTITKV